MEETGLIDPASATDDSGDASRSIRNTLVSKTFRDGAIYLFLRGDYQKPTWFCRVKVPGVKGYIYRSTRSSDEHQAYKFADDLYNQTLVKVLGGANLNAKKIAEAIEGYKKRLEPSRDRLSIHYKLLLVERCLPFLEKKTFDDLDTALLSKLITKLAENSKKGSLSANTIKRIHSDLKHFLGWCVEEGYLDKLPKFPRIASENSRRPHFDEKDWRRLTRHLREFVKVENKATLRDRTMLVNYVLILANTGIRVGEARTLKWRDVRQVDGGTSKNVVLTVKGKTGMTGPVKDKPAYVFCGSSKVTRYVAYFRVSTEKQGKSGLGLAAQRSVIERFLSDGDEVVAEFLEVQSGKKDDRLELWKAIAHAKRHDAKILIAKLDRFSRKVSFIAGIMEQGIGLVIAEMPHATDFQLHIFAALAQEERRLISERTRNALAEAKKRGVQLGKNGKVLGERRRIEARERAQSLRPFIEPLLREGISKSEIARRLNTLGILTPRGNTYKTQQVLNLIRYMQE